MKGFKIVVPVTRSTSLHRWAPDPKRRNRVIPDKTKYSRKGQPKAGPSDVFDHNSRKQAG